MYIELLKELLWSETGTIIAETDMFTVCVDLIDSLFF